MKSQTTHTLKIIYEGVDAVEKHHLWNVKFLNTKSTKSQFLRVLSKSVFFRGSPRVKIGANRIKGFTKIRPHIFGMRAIIFGMPLP